MFMGTLFPAEVFTDLLLFALHNIGKLKGKLFWESSIQLFILFNFIHRMVQYCKNECYSVQNVNKVILMRMIKINRLYNVYEAIEIEV